MKILVATASSDRPETALLCGLAERGHEVCVLGTPGPEHKAALLAKGIRVEEFEVKSRFDYKSASQLKKKVQSWNPDIVHAFTGRTLAAAVRVKSKLKSLGNKTFSLVTYRGTVGHLSRLDPASTCSFLSSKVDAISCVSDAVSNYMQLRNIPKEKLVTIYKGHNPLWYQSSETINRSALGIEDSAFTVICVANARPVKGVDVFIEAANQLSAQKQISFLIAGDIRDQELTGMAKNPRIKFLGFRKDAQALVGISDCLVVPSRGREGLPKALLEALSLNKPIIASKVGGIPEVIRNEQEGLLIPPNDPALLARAIIFLAYNPDKCRQLGTAGHSRLLNDFNVEQMVDKTERLYQQLSSEKRQ